MSARREVLILLLVSFAAVAARADEWSTGTYLYNQAGEITAIGDDSFAYDLAGRLLSGTAGAGRRQDYSFDQFGNILTIVTADANSTPRNVLAVDPHTNQLVSSGEAYDTAVAEALATGGVVVFGTYDDRGNMLSYNGSETFTYDALDVMSTSTAAGVETFHVYGADDERVGTIVVSGAGAGTASWTFRDFNGKILREVYESANGTYSWSKDYIYRGDSLLAAAVPTRHKLLQYHLDHLGTPRLVTGNGGVELARYAYYPFGKDVPAQPGADLGDLKFTGHERDTTTRDYMHARHYNPAAGRFLSVDPGEDSDLGNPQAWNRYAYVRNDPENAVDPSGMFTMVIDVHGVSTGFESIARWLGGNSTVQQLDRWLRAQENRFWRDPQLRDQNRVRSSNNQNTFANWDECHAAGACIGPDEMPLVVGGLGGAARLSQVALRGMLTRHLLANSRRIATGTNIRDVARLVRTYGGSSGGWVKKSTPLFRLGDDLVEIHWYEHTSLGKFELKLVIK